MKSLFTGLERVLTFVTRTAATLAGLCILIVAFIVVYEIIMRGLLGSPTEWVLEISTYLIIVAGFLGFAVAFRDGAHIGVDILTSHFSPRLGAAVRLLMTAIAVFLFFIFMTESTDMVMASYKYNKLSPSILRFPLYIPQISMVVGSALLMLELIRRIILDIYFLVTGKLAECDKAPKGGH